MLFYPWRNERTDILDCRSSYEEKFNLVHDQIAMIKHQYDANSELLEQVEQTVETHPVEGFDEISPNIESIEANDKDKEPIQSENYVFTDRKHVNILTMT